MRVELVEDANELGRVGLQRPLLGVKPAQWIFGGPLRGAEDPPRRLGRRDTGPGGDRRLSRGKRSGTLEIFEFLDRKSVV